MTYVTLTLDIDARGVAYVTLNRPTKRNALSAQMIVELTALAQKLGTDPYVRAVVLAGAGDIFCAGGDLGWMQAQIAADRPTRMAEARKLAMMLHALNEMPKPLIGRIQGAAMGGGVGMACVCDVAIAADDCRFGLTETRLGLIPATIGPYVIARIGEGAARQVFMSSRVFDAATATRLGIVAAACPLADLDAYVEAEVTPYLRVAPSAVAAAKRMARSLGAPITDTIIDQSIAALADIWEGEEAAEGIAAFLDKRKPVWDTSV